MSPLDFIQLKHLKCKLLLLAPKYFNTFCFALKVISSSKFLVIVSPSTGWGLAGGKTEGVAAQGDCG